MELPDAGRRRKECPGPHSGAGGTPDMRETGRVTVDRLTDKARKKGSALQEFQHTVTEPIRELVHQPVACTGDLEKQCAGYPPADNR
jgi:hypothetical protein